MRTNPSREKTDWRDDLFYGHRYQIEDGFVTLPDTPGLGLELNEEVPGPTPTNHFSARNSGTRTGRWRTTEEREVEALFDRLKG